MHNPDAWDAFTKAVGTGQEGELRRAFEALYKSKLDEMVRYAHWCVRRDHNPDLVPGFVLDPEEVVEDAFLRLFLRCRGIAEPKKWLLGFIRNKLKHRVAKVLGEARQNPEAQREINGWQRQRATKSSLSEKQQTAIREAVNSLPKRMRAVIISLYYRAESIATTAAKLGITENTVVQNRRRAVRKLEGLIARG